MADDAGGSNTELPQGQEGGDARPAPPQAAQFTPNATPRAAPPAPPRPQPLRSDASAEEAAAHKLAADAFYAWEAEHETAGNAARVLMTGHPQTPREEALYARAYGSDNAITTPRNDADRQLSAEDAGRRRWQAEQETAAAALAAAKAQMEAQMEAQLAAQAQAHARQLEEHRTTLQQLRAEMAEMALRNENARQQEANRSAALTADLLMARARATERAITPEPTERMITMAEAYIRRLIASEVAAANLVALEAQRESVMWAKIKFSGTPFDGTTPGAANNFWMRLESDHERLRNLTTGVAPSGALRALFLSALNDAALQGWQSHLGEMRRNDREVTFAAFEDWFGGQYPMPDKEEAARDVIAQH